MAHVLSILDGRRGGVILSPPDCPMHRLADFILSASALVAEMPDGEADRADAETLAPLWAEFWHRTPETHSLAGAVAALRAMLLSDHIDSADERVLRSVVAFLEGETNAVRL